MNARAPSPSDTLPLTLEDTGPVDLGSRARSPRLEDGAERHMSRRARLTLRRVSRVFSGSR